MITIKTWRDPYDSGFNTIKPKEIELKEGLTVLVGCNGAGKTTLLMNIEEKLKKESIPVYLFNNLKDGGTNMFGALVSGHKELECDSFNLGASLWTASEGEVIKINIGRQSTLYKDFLKSGNYKNQDFRFRQIFSDKEPEFNTNKRVLLFDATDSGLSIDSVCDIKELFNLIFEDAKKEGIELYIIISANEYELCRNEECFDVNEGKYVNFKDYEDYRKFILKSRTKKEKRIEKTIIWEEKQKKKEEEALKKLECEVEEKKNKIKEKAKSKERELSHSEKYRIEELDRSIEDFKRNKCKFL